MGDARHARLPAFSMAIFSAAALLATPGGARAQFFHLDGILECIDHPESAACRERVRPDADTPVPRSVAAPPRPTVPPVAAHDAVPKQPASASGVTGKRPKPGAAPAGAKPAAPERRSQPASRPPSPPASRAVPASTGSPISVPSVGTAVRHSAKTPAALKRAIAHVQAGRATRDDMAVLEAKAAANDPAAVEVLAWCSLYGRGIPADRVAAYRLYGRAASLGVPRARENQRIIFERLLTNGERQRVLEAANAASGPPRTGTAAIVRTPAERPASP